MTHQHQNSRRWQHRSHVLFHHQVKCTDDSCSCKCLLNLTKKKKRSELEATNPNKHCRTKDSTNFIKSNLSFHSAINSQNHNLISSHGPKPSRSSSPSINPPDPTSPRLVHSKCAWEIHKAHKTSNSSIISQYLDEYKCFLDPERITIIKP
jgi:hypothetical protein